MAEWRRPTKSTHPQIPQQHRPSPNSTADHIPSASQSLPISYFDVASDMELTLPSTHELYLDGLIDIVGEIEDTFLLLLIGRWSS
jgi:hypothetical protein